MPAATAVRAKVCMTCRIEKPACEFNTDRSRRDKLTPRCRDCNKAANRAYRESLNPQHDKTCARCGQGQPFSAFPVNPARPDGRGEWCTACHEHVARQTRTAIALLRVRQAQQKAAAEIAARKAAIEAEEPARWDKKAACRGEETALFFPVGTTGLALLQIEEAKEVCKRCPVAAACLDFALTTGQDHGVYGGMSEDERRALKRRAQRNRARASA